MDAKALQKVIKTASDRMRTDDNTKGTLKYMEHFSWLLFLKVIEQVEDDEALAAEIDGIPYEHSIDATHRWSSWAGGQFTGDGLSKFVSQNLLPYLRSLKGTPRSDAIGQIFAGVSTVMKSGYVLGEVVRLIDEVQFSVDADYHALSVIYETLLGQLGIEAGWSGEFYTPRPIVEFIITVVEPKMGETIYDPCCGTAGFLASAYEYLKPEVVDTSELVRLRESTIYGQESGELPFLLACMNLMLHGIPSPNIERRNTLSEDVSRGASKPLFNVIVTNPPFGGRENPQVQRNFILKYAATEGLFLQHIMAKLRPGGRAGLVVPEGLLYEGTYVALRKRLLDEFNVEAIVRLPDGAFAPYSDVQTNLVFFSKGNPTREIWFYEVPPPDGRRKFSKTRPIAAEDLKECREIFRSRELTARSWLVDRSSLDSNLTLSLSAPVSSGKDAGFAAARDTKVSAVRRDFSTLYDELEASLTRLSEIDDSRFEKVRLETVLHPVRRPTFIEDDVIYRQLTIQYWGRGVKIREERRGKDIGTKRQFLVDAEDLLISRIDARFGAVGVAGDDADGAIVTGDFWTFECNNAAPELLHVILSSPYGVRLMDTASRGSTNRKRLDMSDFLSSDVMMPVDDENQAEVLNGLSMLSSVQSRLSHLASDVQSLDELVRGGLFT